MEEKIFKITETQINQIFQELKDRSTLSVKKILNELEEIKEKE